MGLLDGGPRSPTGMGDLEFFVAVGVKGVFFKHKCIRLMHEKVTIFLYRQYIVVNVC